MAFAGLVLAAACAASECDGSADATGGICASSMSQEKQLSQLPAKELKMLLKKLGLEPKGTKKSMLARLLAADADKLAAAAAAKSREKADLDANNLHTDLDPARYGQLQADVRACADSVFQGITTDGTRVSAQDFFENHFGKKMTHMGDVDGKRAQRCKTIFQLGLMRPLVGSADSLFRNKHINIAANSRSSKCLSQEECVAMFDSGNSTVFVHGLEYFRPAAQLLERELKLRTGLWTHLNVFYTPAGDQHGFGLHVDPTDGLILQLEGAKLWDVCGYHIPDLAAGKLGVDNFGTPHRSTNESTGAPVCVTADGQDSDCELVADTLGLTPTALESLYDDCTQVLLKAGEWLYFPGGSTHMAWSTAQTHSLHLTIGFQRNGGPRDYTSLTWARILEHVAGSQLRQRPPLETIGSNRRFHIVPRAVAADPIVAGWNSSGFHGGAIKRAAFAEDVSDSLFHNMLTEYQEEIAPLLQLSKAAPENARLSNALLDPSHKALRKWAGDQILRQPFMYMPVGLLYDPTTFPHHSKPSRLWEAHRVQHNSPAAALSDNDVTNGVFRRREDTMIVVDREGDDVESGPWRVHEDVTHKFNPFYLKGVVEKEYNQMENRKWRMVGPLVPTSLVKPIKWMLGSSTGAKLRPFRLADVPSQSDEEEVVIAAIKFLWGAGAITFASAESYSAHDGSKWW
eukprot:SAG31_NODE_2908_length_4922_cov_5.967655_3_plen_685_part_00